MDRRKYPRGRLEAGEADRTGWGVGGLGEKTSPAAPAERTTCASPASLRVAPQILLWVSRKNQLPDPMCHRQRALNSVPALSRDTIVRQSGLRLAIRCPKVM